AGGVEGDVRLREGGVGGAARDCEGEGAGRRGEGEERHEGAGREDREDAGSEGRGSGRGGVASLARLVRPSSTRVPTGCDSLRPRQRAAVCYLRMRLITHVTRAGGSHGTNPGGDPLA